MEQPQFEILLRSLIDTFYREYDNLPSDLITLRTIHLELVNKLLKELQLSWGQILQLFRTHVHIHPEMRKELLAFGDEEIESAVVQNFIRTEKITRILKQLTQHGWKVEDMLAVDGLAMNSSNKSNFDPKHYIHNLKFAREGPKSDFDDEPEFKRRHVQAVRFMYKVLLAANSKQPSRHVYATLKYIIKNESNIDLPDVEMDQNLDPKLRKDVLEAYMFHMDKDLLTDFIKSLRLKGEKRTLVDEETLPKTEE